MIQQKDDDHKQKRIGQIEQAMEWLCVPKGENRHMFMEHVDRLRLFRQLTKLIAAVDGDTQVEIAGHWISSLVNDLRDKDLANKVITKMARSLHASPTMEIWAEGRLLSKNMRISPTQLAKEYVKITGQDPRMVGHYVRDMQRIKEKLSQRKRRTGTPERKTNRALAPAARSLETIRQKTKRELRLAERREKEIKERTQWEDAMAAHEQELKKKGWPLP